MNVKSKTIDEVVFPYRAGDGNRNRMTSLEGWVSTIELRPHNLPASATRLRAPAHLPSQAAYRFRPAARTPRPARRMIVGSYFTTTKEKHPCVWFLFVIMRSAAPASRKGAARRWMPDLSRTRAPGLRPSRRLPPRLVIE